MKNVKLYEEFISFKTLVNLVKKIGGIFYIKNWTKY
jgi:hypothetical protein